MAEHSIEMSLPPRALQNVDTKITVRSDRKKLGELHISKGTIEWKAAGTQIPVSLSWEDFASVMNIVRSEST